MFYTIYKITNLIDGKIYIGKHQTKDLNDGYMGSGKHLKSAQNKHGIENFKKEILFQFDNEAEMNTKEAEFVTEEFCLREDTYNLCPGGKGGWGYVNEINPTLRTKGHTDEMYERISITLTGRSNPLASARLKQLHSEGKMRYDTFKGKSHKEEAKRKIGEANSKLTGQRNSQFGTMWITNGQENKKIKKDVDIIPEGWYTGKTVVPLFSEIQMCIDCFQIKTQKALREDDLYWWNKYLESKLSITKFVKDIYPKNRASFYNMKERLNNM